MTSCIHPSRSVSVPQFESEWLLLRKLLEGRLVVPAYHREYAWTASMANDFLRSILGTLDGRQRVSIGPIILTSGDSASHGADDVCEIVDGLQRLTTVLLILSALRQYLLRGSTDAVERHANLQAAARASALNSALCCAPSGGGAIPPVRLTACDPGAEVLHILLRSGDAKKAAMWLLHEAEHGECGVLAQCYGGRVLAAWHVLNRTLESELTKGGGLWRADELAYQLLEGVYVQRRFLPSSDCAPQVYLDANHR